jgi:hypothetical protein
MSDVPDVLPPGFEAFCQAMATPDAEGRFPLQTDAYRTAYPRAGARAATVEATKMMKRPEVRRRIAELRNRLRDEYVERHLPLRALIERLAGGLDATQVQVAKHMGTIGEEREYPDYNARRAYLELALKLRGDLVDKHQHTFDHLSDDELLSQIVQGITRGSV